MVSLRLRNDDVTISDCRFGQYCPIDRNDPTKLVRFVNEISVLCTGMTNAMTDCSAKKKESRSR